MECYSLYNNFNYVIQRTKEYNPKGRMQTEDDAKAIDLTTIQVLDQFNLPYRSIPYGDEGVNIIVDDFARFMVETKNV